MDYKSKFLTKCVLGHKVDLMSPEAVIKACCSKAYDNMNTGIKYVWSSNNPNSQKNGKEDFISEYTKLLYNNNNNNNLYFSKQLIYNCYTLFGVSYSTNKDHKISTTINKSTREFSIFGACQKLVNMSFKYFYVFDELIKNKLAIDYSECDCPLDSIILNSIHLESNSQSIKWTTILENDYDSIQSKIKDLIQEKINQGDDCSSELKGLGNLAYDFIQW